MLELKPPPPGVVRPTAYAVWAVLSGLRGAGLSLDVTVSSFEPSLVGAFQRLVGPAAGTTTALLGMPGHRPHDLLRQALSGRHDEVHPHVGVLLAEPIDVERAHGHGVRVIPWTVNRARDLRRLADLGVDGVITDVPSSARAAVGAGRLAASVP